MNDTVMAPSGGTGTSSQQNAGEELLRNVQSTAAAFEKGDWLGGAMGVAKVAMNAMDVVGDPLGAIGSAGVGWVLGAVSFLREPFDVLKGDSGAVSSSAQSWGGCGTSLSGIADQFRQAATDQTRSWTGVAADGYRAASNNQANALSALGQANQAVANAMQQAGQAVAQVRQTVMDVLSEVVQKIIMICLEALSMSWLSFGASIAKGIAQSVQQAVSAAQKMIQQIQSLIQTLQRIIQVIQKVVQIAQQVKELVELIGGKASAQQPRTMSSQQITSTGAMASDTNPNGGDVLAAAQRTIASGYQYRDPAVASGGAHAAPTSPTQTRRRRYHTPEAAGAGGTGGVASPRRHEVTSAQYHAPPAPGAGGGITTPAGQAPVGGPVAAPPMAGGGVQPAQAQPPVAVPAQAPARQGAGPAPQGPVSQNGWPVNPPRSTRTIPGTNARVNVADGDAGDVLMHVLGQVNSRVENIDLNSAAGEHDDWGFAERTVRGGSDMSNHASGTAVDINATRHGLGERDTFTPAQVQEIHTILGEVDNVVRWGGDYTGRADEMHFEIVGTPEEVARVAERLRAAQ
jgi:uncharacterized protein YukE